MKQIISILLIFTVIYTTIGVRINEHYCEISNTTSYSYFEVEDCCPKTQNSCPFHQKKNDCCSDEVNIVHLDHDIHFQSESIEAKLLVSHFSLLPLEYKSLGSNTFEVNVLKGRAPPLILQNEDLQARLQVYRL